MIENYKKYAELLLKRCLSLKEHQPLVINAPVDAIEFVRILVDLASSMNIRNIYFDWYDDEIKHSLLKHYKSKDIINSKFWNKSVYDEYTKKGSAFLFLTSNNPDIMKDINSNILNESSKFSRTSRPLYKEKQKMNEIAWCIASVSTLGWSKKVFPNSNDPINDLWNAIFDICLINTDNPIKAWDDLINKNQKIKNKLNSLNIKELHYINSLGTDLKIGLPKNHEWHCGDSILKDGTKLIVNMPTLEIFTSPDKFNVNGVVYSAKPLIYAGTTIDNFYIEFNGGKVSNFKAKNGEDTLRNIINSDDTSNLLGEVALVEYDSKISKSEILFYETLYDENASCHLALGDGFPECIKNGLNMSKEELIEEGINSSTTHVDFMVGTKDMEIIANTIDGKTVKIFENGNFSKNLID